MKNTKIFMTLFLFTQLWSVPLSTAYGESTNESNPTIEETFKSDDIDIDKKIQMLVEYIYDQNQIENPVQLSSLKSILGAPQSIEQNSDKTEQHIYQFDDHNGAPIELTLAVDTDNQYILEAMAVVDIAETSEELATVSLDDVTNAGDTLKDIYEQKEHAHISDLENIWSLPSKISYIYDLTIYHYNGEFSNQQIALTVSDGNILALNYQHKTDSQLAQPIDATKRELDQISHTAGVTWQEMTNRFGKPMGLNYNSEKGIITLSWHSDADDSVSDVYYYMAYNGIGIGLQYQ